eukprot:1999491-Rhodomonas_salina.2
MQRDGLRGNDGCDDADDVVGRVANGSHVTRPVAGKYVPVGALEELDEDEDGGGKNDADEEGDDDDDGDGDGDGDGDNRLNKDALQHSLGVSMQRHDQHHALLL